MQPQLDPISANIINGCLQGCTRWGMKQVPVQFSFLSMTFV